MKNILLIISALILTGSLAKADTFKIESVQHLVGNDGIDFHLVVRQDGSIITYAGRSEAHVETIKEIKDLRPTDGSLEIIFADGAKLVQTSGFSIDGIQHIFFVRPNGTQFEMTPVAYLKIVK